MTTSAPSVRSQRVASEPLDILRRHLRGVRRELLWARAWQTLVLAATLLAVWLSALGLAGSLWPSVAGLERSLALLCAAGAAGIGLARLVFMLLRYPRLFEIALRVERRFPSLEDRVASAVDDTPVGLDFAAFSPGLVQAARADAVRALEGVALDRVVDWAPVLRSGYIALASVIGCAFLVALPPAAAPAATAPLQRPRHPPVTQGATVRLFDLTLEIRPPAYTGLPAEQFPSWPPEVRALRGSRAVVRARTESSLLRSAQAVGTTPRREAGSEAPLHAELLQRLPGEEQPRSVAAKVEDGVLTAETVLRQSAVLTLRVSRGDAELLSPDCRITIVPDASPSVTILQPGKDLQWTEVKPLKVALTASDDFAISRVELAYRRGVAGHWQRQEVPCRPGREVRAALSWDLTPLQLKPGETLLYRALVADNDAVSGPKTASSRTYSIELSKPSPVQLEQQVRAAEQAEREALDRLRQEAEELGRRLEELRRAAEQESNAAARERRLAQLAEAQKELQRLGERLDHALGNTERELEQGGRLSEAAREKLSEIHNLLRETIQGELREALERVAEALRQQEPQQLKQATEEARASQEDLLERLDQAISLLKRLQLEQRLARAAQLAEQTAAEQQKLNERRQAAEQKPESTQESELRQQAQQQRSLRDQAQFLEQESKALAHESEAQQAPSAEELSKLAAELERQPASAPMQQAAEQLQQGRASQAAPAQQTALSQLRQAAARLNQALADLTGAQRRKLMEGLSRLTRESLALSREQERALQRTKDLAPRQPLLPGRRTGALSAEAKDQAEQAAAGQQAVAEGTRRLAKALRELSHETELLDPAMARATEDLAEQMAQASREIRGGASWRATQRQEAALAELNRTARRLLAQVGQAGQEAQQMARGELLQLLRSLAQRQRELNAQTRQQAAGKRQSRPGGLSTGELAGLQEAIRQALNQLLGTGPGQSLADQLGEVPGQMEDVEDDLKQDRLQQRTLRLQEDIVHRMLDAQRSIHEKEQRHHERKAERPRPYRTPPSPPRLTAEQTGAPPKVQIPTTLPDEPLPLDFENLVRGYFRALATQGARE